MYPIIKQADRIALRTYTEKFDNPGFVEHVDSHTVAPGDELALETYQKLLSIFEAREHANDPGWPRHQDRPASARSLPEIQQMAFRTNKQGVLDRINRYEAELRSFDAQQLGSITVGEFKRIVASILSGTE